VNTTGDINEQSRNDLIISATIAKNNTVAQSYTRKGNNNAYRTSYEIYRLEGYNGTMPNHIAPPDKSGIEGRAAGENNRKNKQQKNIPAMNKKKNAKRNARQSYVGEANSKRHNHNPQLPNNDGPKGHGPNQPAKDHKQDHQESQAGQSNEHQTQHLNTGEQRTDTNEKNNTGQTNGGMGTRKALRDNRELYTKDPTKACTTNATNGDNM